jgi:hypothetical protein
MPDSRYLFFLNDSIITRKQYVQRKLVLYSSSVPKARVKPFSSIWFERKREESTYKAVGSYSKQEFR